MIQPIGVQLYSLRNLAAKDFVSVLKKVAQIGYRYVEPAGFWTLRPSEFKKIIADLGLQMVSSHSPWARQANSLGEVMEIASIIGVNKVVCGYGPDQFKDLASIQATADNTNAMREVLARNGFTLFQHNHDFEFQRLDGKIKYQIYKELCPGLKYQIDSFWSTNLGRENAVEMLKLFADSTILIHMKDGVCRQDVSGDKMVNGILERKVDLRALGTGNLPIRDIIAAAPSTVEAIIVELDYCNIDMMTAIEQSYAFMTQNKLAVGNK